MRPVLILSLIVGLFFSYSQFSVADSTQAVDLETLSPDELETLFVDELEKQYSKMPEEFVLAEQYLLNNQSHIKVRTPLIRPTQKIGIICVSGKLGLALIKGQIGLCRAGTKKFYTLAALTGGITIQLSGGFFLGAIETYNNSRIDGSYEIISAGYSPGVSMEGLVGKSGDNKLVLAGLALGLGFDISGGTLLLEPLFNE